jgi:hypothetical protein
VYPISEDNCSSLVEKVSLTPQLFFVKQACFDVLEQVLLSIPFVSNSIFSVYMAQELKRLQDHCFALRVAK